MGSLWEPYGKGVPFLVVPGNSLILKGTRGLVESEKLRGPKVSKSPFIWMIGLSVTCFSEANKTSLGILKREK